MTANPKTITTLFVLAVSILGLLGARALVLYSRSTPTQTLSSVSETPSGDVTVYTTYNPSSEELEVWIDAIDGANPSTISLSLSGSSDSPIIIRTSKPFPSDALTSDGVWSIPFSNVESSVDQLSFSLTAALAYTGPEETTFRGALHVFSIPVGQEPDTIALTLDTNLSEAYSTSNQPLLLTLKHQSVTVK